MTNRTARQRTHRLVVVDDHPLVRQGLEELLRDEADLELVGGVADGAGALAALDEHDPDLFVVDLSLEDDESGLELIKQLKARDDALPVLVLSMHDDLMYAERCLKAGALGYINKASSADQTLTAIRTVLSGDVYLSDEVSSRVLQRAVGGEPAAETRPVDTLTDREIEVFERIGEGLTTREIAEVLHLSPKTIETHRAHIKEKLGLDNANQLMRRAVQWVLESR